MMVLNLHSPPMSEFRGEIVFAEISEAQFALALANVRVCNVRKGND